MTSNNADGPAPPLRRASAHASEILNATAAPTPPGCTGLDILAVSTAWLAAAGATDALLPAATDEAFYLVPLQRDLVDWREPDAACMPLPRFDAVTPEEVLVAAPDHAVTQPSPPRGDAGCPLRWRRPRRAAACRAGARA